MLVIAVMWVSYWGHLRQLMDCGVKLMVYVVAWLSIAVSVESMSVSVGCVSGWQLVVGGVGCGFAASSR